LAAWQHQNYAHYDREYQKRNLKIGMYSAFQKTAYSNPEDQKDKISEI